MPSTILQRDQDNARPPSGPRTPKVMQENDGSNMAFLSTYDRMFKGWKGSPAKPIRHRTAQHFPAGMWSNHSNYQQTFRTPNRYSRHGIVPASVNRHHKPHPSQLVWPLEPNKAYMIWKPASDRTPPRLIESAPPSILQFDRYRQMNTTYKDFFKGYQSLDLLRHVSGNSSHVRPRTEEKSKYSPPMTSANEQARRPTTEELRSGSRPATIGANANSMYKHAFQGEFARPSTLEKPPDRSWANIRY